MTWYYQDQPGDIDPERAIDAELSRPVPAPDLTRAIMGRLGYMQAAPAAVRRRRTRLWINRCALVMGVCVVGTVAMMVVTSSPQARRPADATMPAAISSDLQQSQHRMNSLLQMLQQLPSAVPVELDDTHDGMHDGRWQHPLDKEIDRSAIAPVRWV